MKKKRITNSLIKSKIPKKFFDCSRANGIGLEANSYAITSGDDANERHLLTSGSSAVIRILKEHFKVEFIEPFWEHYNRYSVSLKEREKTG